ncbi:MAG TPA: sulfatase-like hydrolase/transferase [Gammaproteobacteria bacterium]|jgi:arylsulfatase A-like enzyme
MFAKRNLAAVLSLPLVFVASPAFAQADNHGNAPPAGRPNILLVISDDVGFDVTPNLYPGLIEDLTARYGPTGLNHPRYQTIAGRPASTPVLDDLARQGIVFTNVWAHPFCSPTRASIMTGLFAAKTHVASYQDALSKNHTTFVRRLKDEAGYRTAIFGKWHLAGLPGNPVSYPGMKPRQAGFDVFKGNMHAALATFWNYDYQLQDESTPADEWRTETPPQRSVPGVAATSYAPVVNAADTIEWITARERENPDKPWFVWLASNLSHATIQRSPSQMAVPNVDTLDAESAKEMRDCGGEFGTANLGSCSGEAVMRAMTNSLDTTLGIVLEAVDDLDPNTYVIYIGDNGTPMYGRPGLDFIDNMYITRSGRGKGTVYESGARVPLAIRGPRIEAGSASDEYVHAADLYSTILELAGLDVPEQVSSSDGSGTVPLDAVSLAPILFDGATAVRDPNMGYVLTETHDLMRGGIREVAARNKRYKVLCTDGVGLGDCKFYDLARDPLEEYALPIPEKCDEYVAGSWTPADAAWHYCRLTEVVATESFLSKALESAPH